MILGRFISVLGFLHLLQHAGQRMERRRTKKMTKKMRRTMVKRMVSNSNFVYAFYMVLWWCLTHRWWELASLRGEGWRRGKRSATWLQELWRLRYICMSTITPDICNIIVNNCQVRRFVGEVQPSVFLVNNGQHNLHKSALRSILKFGLFCCRLLLSFLRTKAISVGTSYEASDHAFAPYIALAM